MNCNICGNSAYKEYFKSNNIHGRSIIDKNEEFIINKCPDCGNFFINIIPDDEYYRKYYNTGYYDSSVNNSIINFVLSLLGKISISQKIRIIRKYFINKESKIKILDIGCGGGDFLSKLPDIFDKTGLERNKEGFEVCLKKGLRVINDDIFTYENNNQRFDVISLWHVLEHIQNPAALLNKIQTLLSDDGILIMQIPNSKSIGFKYGKSNWFHLDTPRHIWWPNIESLNFLGSKTGFKIIKIVNEFYDYPLDLFWSIRERMIKFIIYPLYFFFKILTREHITVVLKREINS